LDKECWRLLCENAKALPIIAHHLHKVDTLGWENLSRLPEAIKLLTQNVEKINYVAFSSNPNLFDLVGVHRYNIKFNSVVERKRMHKLYAELIAFVLHPDWLKRMAQTYNATFMDYVTKFYNAC
jgi:hypothetical protein